MYVIIACSYMIDARDEPTPSTVALSITALGSLWKALALAATAAAYAASLAVAAPAETNNSRKHRTHASERKTPDESMLTTSTRRAFKPNTFVEDHGLREKDVVSQFFGRTEKSVNPASFPQHRKMILVSNLNAEFSCAQGLSLNITLTVFNSVAGRVSSTRLASLGALVAIG